ncbi:MAG TPA: cytochrome c oxidase accessory protein CcoG [Gemmatales bacterium]|nr:cytochrome c oxidase accessory protein CcoG [Gemmatales bacterium]
MSSLLMPEEHVLSTLEKDGSRRWLFPRLSPGVFWKVRWVVAYGLILLFVLLPHWRIGGKPAILLDLINRQFSFFGLTLLPTDTLLLALFMVSVFLTIFLLTALFGRVWCGWACPQTVYMEYVFRPIERLFDGTRGKGGRPSSQTPFWRRSLKYVAYLLIAMLLAHTFLAYFVGVEQLSHWIRRSPVEHPAAFIVMAVVTGLMLFDFCYFREQLCLVACPYGRLQSVLLDKQSLIVAYDVKRGEPRGKFTKELPMAESHQGDCIDCKLCVRTCPTGIDIRNGLQMECIHCTQCIDACDEIMDKISKPRGLIRYSCQEAIEGLPHQGFRPRLVIYPLLLLVAISAFIIVLINRAPVDVTVLRNIGSPFNLTPDGQVQNTMLIKLVNRQTESKDYTIELLDTGATPRDQVKLVVEGLPWRLEPLQLTTHSILITVPPSAFTFGHYDLKLAVKEGNTLRKEITCRLLGP